MVVTRGPELVGRVPERELLEGLLAGPVTVRAKLSSCAARRASTRLRSFATPPASRRISTWCSLFSAMGVEAFAQPAVAELAASGERRHPHLADSPDELTPQERQIADLARDGGCHIRRSACACSSAPGRSSGTFDSSTPSSESALGASWRVHCDRPCDHGMRAARAPFRGRFRERRELDGLLGVVRGGRSAALVIRGEPGIGKTALLHYCLRQASGCRVALVTGVQSELELPYAGLHQLCLPLLDDLLPRLPSPQADALRVAFGLTSGRVPDRLMVGLATLSLLAEAAADRPLVCVIDDAQWLDESSAQALGFVGRRLLADSVLLLFGMRVEQETRPFAGLPLITLQGLTDEDARGLVTAAVPGHLDPRIRDRIVAETQGNPLALLELTRAMSQSELAGGFVFPSLEHLSSQMQERYLRRVRALPASTQTLMLLAAADPTGDATLLWRAADALHVGVEAAAAAEEEQLLHVGARVEFHHPLVRAAAYTSGSIEQRGAAHRALAEATDAGQNPERRAWHLAAAADGPDEAVARELERTAGAAQARAGLAAASAFLHRSFLLTADPECRADRAIAAAAAKVQAGDFPAALHLIAEATANSLDALQRAHVEQLTGQIAAATHPGGAAPLRLLEAAQRLERLDVRLARDTYLQARWAALLAGRFAAPGGDLMEISRAALAAPWPEVVRPCDLALEALAMAITEGRRAAATKLDAVIVLYLEDKVSDDDWVQWGRCATSAAYTLLDFDRYLDLSSRHVARIRESGALSELAVSLNFHTNVVAWSGDLEGGAALVAELRSVKEATGIRMGTYGGRLIAAYRGHRKDLVEFDNEFTAPGDGYAQEQASLAVAVLNNGLGHFEDAVAAARDVAPSWSVLRPFVLTELVEAAARTGQVDLAQAAFAELEDLGVPGSHWAEGLEARSRAFLHDGDQAEHCYLDAVAHLEQTELRIELARCHLLYGEWLRREMRADGRARPPASRTHRVRCRRG